MFDKLRRFINGKTLLGEIVRFLLVGGLATVVDFFMMGVTLYFFAPDKYPSFFNVFHGATEKPELIAACFGTGIGFIFGLIANYVLSIIFVFNEKGNSKSVKGFLVFAFFSAIGLGIHEVGMYLFNGVLLWNEWLVKILLTFIVLIYNFVTRKLLIFKKASAPAETQSSFDA
ncbi:MAG: GtrA family protein [Clostridia bacterium]|nr:GtrA family protein [Clostridia bacterium]